MSVIVVNYDSDNGWSTLLDKFKTTPAITKEVSDALDNLKGVNVGLIDSSEGLKEAVGYSTDEFYEFAKSCDTSGDVLQQYKDYTAQASTATSKFASSLKSVVANIGIMLAVNAAIKVATYLWDEANVTVAEMQERYDELASSLQTLNDEYDELNSRDYDTLSQSEKDRLEYLDKRIEREKELLEIQERQIAREKVGDKFTDYFDEDSYVSKYNELDGGLFYSDKYSLDNKQLEVDISQYESLLDTIDRLQTELDAETEGTRAYQKKFDELMGWKSRLTQMETEFDTDIDTLYQKMSEAQSVVDELNETIANGGLTGNDLTNAEERLAEFEGLVEHYEDYYNRLSNLRGGNQSIADNISERLGNSLSADDLQSKFSADELEILYCLTFDKDATEEELRTAIAEMQKVLEESGNEMEVLWDYSETISQLDTIKDKFDTLDKTYAKLFNSDSQIGFEDYSAINEAFSDVEGIENYIQKLQQAGQNSEEVTAVMEDLIGAYIEQSQILENVNEQNADLIIQTLTELGVQNSKQLVLDRLTNSLNNMSSAEALAYMYGLDLTNITVEEINALIAEGAVSAQTAQQLALFALKKELVNNVRIETEDEVSRIYSLAKAAGIGAEALAKFAQFKNDLLNAGDDAALRSNIIKSINAYKSTLYSEIENAEVEFESPEYKIPDVVYGGGSSSQKAISDATSSAKKEFSELFDFFEERVDKLNDAISLLDANLENVTGSYAKNTLLNQEIGLNAEKINGYTDALAMYSQKASEALSSIPSDLRDKVVNGAVDLSTFVGENGEQVVEAIKEYQKWSDKISDCKQELAKLGETIRQLELDKFNNIMNDFQNQFDIRDDSKSLIEKQIALLEEAGELIGESFYTAQIEQSQKQLSTLEQEKVALTQQLTSALASGNIQQGTDEWLEMVSALNDVDESILDCKTSIEEFDNALLELHTEVFERIQEQFSNLDSELENLGGLFDDFDVSDGNGNWSAEGITRLGLLTQQYELAKYQVQQYNDEIEQLNAEYLAGRYSATEYADRLAELSQAQWEAVNASESIKDAIVELNEVRIDEIISGIEEEKEAYRELIDAKIEALQAEKDLHDYRESIAEKTKSITDLERQIAAMQNDNTASTVAKRKKLEEQLAEARKDLEETQYDHSIEAQEDVLNKEYENFEQEKDNEIEKLQESLEEREQLIAESFENVKANTDVIGQQIANIAQQHGITVSNAIVSSWKSGETAIASYGSVLSVQSSAFIGQLMGVENEVWNLQAQANTTATSLANMFSTRADNLVNQLTSSYNSAYNMNAMTNALQSSLVNTLERGYNVSGITSALNSIANAANGVASAANNATTALANMGASKSTTKEKQTFGNSNEYYYVDRNGNKTYIGNTGYVSKTGKTVSKYASGTRSAKGGLSITDEEGYELKLPKLSNGNYTITGEGDQILTKAQTDNIFDWAKFNPADIIPSSVQSLVSKNNTSNIMPRSANGASLNIGKLIEVNGNIDNTNITRMENVAKKAVNDAFTQLNKQIRYGGN